MATRREREEREQRYAQARRWATEQLEDRPHADPTDYGIEELDAIRDTLVVVYCRESGRKQDLRTQMKGFRVRLTRVGVRVKKQFGEVGSGKSLKEEEREEFFQAVAYARRHNLPLVAPCFSRFLRSVFFHKTLDARARPSKEEVEELIRATEGVRLPTWGDPNNTCAQDEDLLKKLHALGRDKRKGRPFKKKQGKREARKNKWKKRVIKMRKEGKSYQAIADHIRKVDKRPVDRTTVANWVR